MTRKPTCAICGCEWEDMNARLLDSGYVICVKGDGEEKCLKDFFSKISPKHPPASPPPMTPGLANLRFGVTENRCIVQS